MCGLCGALGSSQYWTDAAGHPEFQRNGASMTRREERERRVLLINRVLQMRGLAVRDWGGSSYLLEGERGNLQNVYNLAGIWSAVDEHTSGSLLDPLDPALLDHLESGPA